MNTLWLHIGTHKTATTTIQDFLAANNDVFVTKGYTYPTFPFHYPFRAENRNGLFLGTPYLDGDGVRQESVEKENLEQGLAIVHDLFKTYPNVIISNERLWHDLFRSKARLLRPLLEDSQEFGYQIKMVVYLRRQDKFIESYWNEQIKSNVNETRSLLEYIPSYKFLDYKWVFSRLGDLAGDENLIVRRFDEVVKGDGIIADFMKQIGLELTDEYTIPEAKSNQGLYGNTLEIKRVINGLDSLQKVDMSYLRESMAMCSSTSRKNYPCSEMSEDERAELMAKYKEGNDYVADRFIGDGKPLFSDDYSGLPKREDGNSEYLNDVIRTAAAESVVLLRRIKESELAIAELTSRVEKLEAANAKLNDKLSKVNDRIDRVNLRIDRAHHPIKTLLGKNKLD